jgi:hypothetical protein
MMITSRLSKLLLPTLLLLPLSCSTTPASSLTDSGQPGVVVLRQSPRDQDKFVDHEFLARLFGTL